MVAYEMYNGVKIPSMGLGTASLSRMTMQTSIEAAISKGCTLIDTANAYQSERFIGPVISKLIAEKKVSRNDLFVSSKVGDKLDKRLLPIGYYFYNSPSSPCHDTKKVVYEQVEQSLKHLRTDYIDLMLIHWPYSDVLNEIWKYLEELYDQKVLRAIGVSNCKKRHIERIMKTANYKPMVNQICISPINTCVEDYEFCKENNIIIEAYSPMYTLKSPTYKGKSEILSVLGSKKNKTPGQVLLRWYYQKGIIPIPRSCRPERVKSNYDIFDFSLDENEMKQIDGLNTNFNYLVESLFCPGY